MLKHCSFAVALLLATLRLSATETDRAQSAADWLTRPLSLPECINLALKQNSAILKGKSDLEAAYGVVVQTRAIAIPKLRATGNYQFNNAIENLQLPPPAPSVTFQQDQSWSAGIRLVQSVYEGGRIRSSLTSARLTKEHAIYNYQAVIADTLTEVRVAYYDILMAAEQIVVQEASVKLLTQELGDTTRRFEAGTVPRFNVLRAEVELANARPRLIRAKNSHRIAKNNLANLLGYNLPKEVWEDIPLQLADKLDAGPYEIQLPDAIGQAMEKRPELAALRKAELTRKEGITSARSMYQPSVQAFGGYGWRSSQFSDDPGRDVSGWNAGLQLNWDIFDGLLTRGKVDEAKAVHKRAEYDVEDATRRIELEVRSAYSNFIEAKEVLESQKKVVEQAEEALRLANARADAGTGTQLDVLSAQTALTEARSTQVQALHDYAVARARLERAIGNSAPPSVTEK
ncbi:MAG: TolC family protein [Verrucomicrobia bacterium]|nr:MAG: TolC family protein [Verrucomicrobiota bacterium]